MQDQQVLIQSITIYIILEQYGIFLSIGKKKERDKIITEEIDGKINQKIVKERYLEFGIVSDERICDRTLFFKLYEKNYEIFKESRAFRY